MCLYTLYEILPAFDLTQSVILQQLPLQSVPITTKVVSSNHAHGVVFYSIQHSVIKFCRYQPEIPWKPYFIVLRQDLKTLTCHSEEKVFIKLLRF
jgi:hypothetical protein